ncbi:MAG TPA: hypothetical protein VKV17_12930 [Bryobacteraceae bacterium]|nr:hypothetical protein [Bryobacteraceae bacterium]
MIGVPFFFKRLMQQLRVVLKAKAAREIARSAIAGHFVMFDTLRGRDQGGVGDGWGSIFVHQVFTFIDDPFYAFALLTFRGFSEFLEYPFDALGVDAGLLEVVFEGLPQLRGTGGFRHLGQGLDNALFGVV